MAPRLRRGVLVTLEGGEGAGKSALAAALAKLLPEDGYAALVTQEPAGIGFGRTIKALFEWLAIQDEATTLSPIAEMFLFEARRAQHVDEVVRPALERGEVVLCDRFTDSTLAYQGYGRGLNLDHIRACNHIATGGLAPDLTLLLDVPPEVGLGRAQGRALDGAGDAIGQESLEFHRRVREGFLALARREPRRIVVIDAGLPTAAVTTAAWQKLRDFLEHTL